MTTTRPVRVLQALTTAELGGTERMVLRLLGHIDRTRVQCHLSVLRGGGPVIEYADELSVPTFDLAGPGGHMGAWWRFRNLLLAERYDIIHLYGFRMSVIGRTTVPLVTPRPKVIHGIRGVHVTESEEISTWKTQVAIAIERLAAPLVDIYVANSHDAVRHLVSQGIRGSFLVIYNGIEVPQMQASKTTDSAALEVVCVATFRPRKRHLDLVAALRHLRDRGVPLRCTMVGDGPMRPNVAALVRECGLEDVVHFTGRCTPEQIQGLLERADAFVLPSLWEGLPGAVMEAMASGLPVVATDVPGTRELVIDGVTGYLVPPKDPTALAQGLQRLAQDATARAAMGQAGRLRITTEFSMATMITRHEELYEALAGTAPWPAWTPSSPCVGSQASHGSTT